MSSSSKPKEKILVAMSGGVDSSVAALHLQEQGISIVGAYMRTWHDDDQHRPIGQCPWEEDLHHARSVAEQLRIPFSVVNMIEHYRQWVVQPLIEGYRHGITPNPDIFCNQFIKFGFLADYARELGCSGIATGHYCQKITHADGHCDLLEGHDPDKDQSYFLAYISQEQLQFAQFPVGHFLKKEVRTLATRAQLGNASRKDSQGICFLGKVRIQDFLAHYIPDSPGLIVDTKGRTLGEHSGLHKFTLGQRHGIRIPSNHDYQHYVVVAKDLESNHLIVTLEHSSSEKLFQKKITLRNLHFIHEIIDHPKNLLGKPRYRDPAQKIYFEPTGPTTAVVEFQVPQRALASGQILALYHEKCLLGGGIYV
ncbi:MAG: tRNA 2-thiouridine(34) synthase MnmA [Puniceicoccales bacterium]|nr:tRNA 2-thiouridine(34) synthase MnmA [Puniceicoccales bacterium]